MKTYRFVALPPRTPGTPGRRGWPRQWRPRPRAASRGIACRRRTPTFPTQRFRFTHPGFHASWLLLSLRNINLIFYYRDSIRPMRKIALDAALWEISSYFYPPQMSARVLYFRYAVEPNIARDRIAEMICGKPKIFWKRNAASFVSDTNIFV